MIDFTFYVFSFACRSVDVAFALICGFVVISTRIMLISFFFFFFFFFFSS